MAHPVTPSMRQRPLGLLPTALSDRSYVAGHRDGRQRGSVAVQVAVPSRLRGTHSWVDPEGWSGVAAISVTISGSFHRHLAAIMEAVQEFRSRGATVLSPQDPRVVASSGTFVFVASDKHRSVRLVQDRHLAAISESTFLWLVAPDGYIGQSASLELGFAIACGTPILSEVMPPDPTLAEYVRMVSSPKQAIEIACALAVKDVASERCSSLLVDPPSVIRTAHERLEVVDGILKGSSLNAASDPARQVLTELSRLSGLLRVGRGTADVIRVR